MNAARCQRLIGVVILDIVVLWNTMYHDQVVRFEAISLSMMSKEDRWGKIFHFSMTYYVDGPRGIFVIITKREYLNNFLCPKFLGINFPLKPTWKLIYSFLYNII